MSFANAVCPPHAWDAFSTGFMPQIKPQVEFKINPDNQRYNNYNAQGNVNPYSGERGTQRHEFSNPPVQQIQPYQNPYPQQRRGY